MNLLLITVTESLVILLYSPVHALSFLTFLRETCSVVLGLQRYGHIGKSLGYVCEMIGRYFIRHSRPL